MLKRNGNGDVILTVALKAGGTMETSASVGHGAAAGFAEKVARRASGDATPMMVEFEAPDGSICGVTEAGGKLLAFAETAFGMEAREVAGGAASDAAVLMAAELARDFEADPDGLAEASATDGGRGYREEIAREKERLLGLVAKLKAAAGEEDEAEGERAPEAKETEVPEEASTERAEAEPEGGPEKAEAEPEEAEKPAAGPEFQAPAPIPEPYPEAATEPYPETPDPEAQAADAARGTSEWDGWNEAPEFGGTPEAPEFAEAPDFADAPWPETPDAPGADPGIPEGPWPEETGEIPNCGDEIPTEAPWSPEDAQWGPDEWEPEETDDGRGGGASWYEEEPYFGE